jgi:hypothetical protein
MTPWTVADRLRQAFREHKTEMLTASAIGFIVGALFF